MNRITVLLMVILMLSFFSSEAQCAMCRAVLESDESGNAAKGINNGIIYLMLFPYLLIGGIGYAIYKMKQNSSKESTKKV